MSQPLWNPTFYRRFEKKLETSTGVARIITDAGPAYIKALGNNEGPHALARELIGTTVAKWLGIQTLDFTIFNVEPEDDIPLGHNKKALPGPAFLTKAIDAAPWGGTLDELKTIQNREDIMKIVLLDTWILNADRYPPLGLERNPNPDNILIRKLENGRNVVCIDHTHCLYSGSSLNKRISTIEFTKDARLYGMFPCFCEFLGRGAVAEISMKIAAFDYDISKSITKKIPEQWEVNRETRNSISEFLVQRAAFVAENAEAWLEAFCHSQSCLLL